MPNVQNIRIIIDCLSLLIALGLCIAVGWIGRRRPGITTPADPFSKPFGDVPGFSREQLEYIARKSPDEPYVSVGALVQGKPAQARWWPHDRPLYSGSCTRCGASTAAEFALSCFPDPFSSVGALRSDAGGDPSFIPSDVIAARTELM